jgi:hypothetical protein
MTMILDGRHRYGGWVASLLIAVFFLSQAFSCCMFNRKIGSFLANAWKVQETAGASHDCCPKPPEGGNSAGHDDSECGKGACCIQDGNQRVPQLASDASGFPVPAGMVLDMPPARGTPPRKLLSAVSGSKAASGPPIYLATRRILV